MGDSEEGGSRVLLVVSVFLLGLGVVGKDFFVVLISFGLVFVFLELV